MLKKLIYEYDILLNEHTKLKDKYDKSEKACQEFNKKYIKLMDEHVIYKNKYMKIRRKFEYICILYVIMGGLYYINFIDAQLFHLSTVIMILLSLGMS